MARVEKNAAGKAVPVDTPEFGCITIGAVSHTKTKAKPVKDGAEAADKGEI